MKNLPEDELFNALEDRLRNYQEDPDDNVWKEIRTALPSREPEWVIWTNRIAAGFLLFSLVFLLFPERVEYTSVTATKANTTPGASTYSGRSDSIYERPVIERLAGQHRESDSSGMKKEFTNYSALADVTTNTSVPPVEIAIGLTDKVAAVSGSLSAPIDGSQVCEKKNEDTVPDSVLLPKREVHQAPVQVESSKKKPTRKSAITLYSMITPLLSFHKVSPNSNDNIVIESMHNPPVLSVRRLGVSMEVGIVGRINPRWQYTAGLSYYHQSHNVAYQQQGNAIITSEDNMSYQIVPGTIENSFDYTMHNVGVQTGILHTLTQRGLIHKAGVLIQYQHGLSSASQNEAYNNATSHYLNYQLLYRVEYKLSSKVSFFMQPTFTHSLISKESLQAPFRIKQTRAGIGVGIVYSF